MDNSTHAASLNVNLLCRQSSYPAQLAPYPGSSWWCTRDTMHRIFSNASVVTNICRTIALASLPQHCLPQICAKASIQKPINANSFLAARTAAIIPSGEDISVQLIAMLSRHFVGTDETADLSTLQTQTATKLRHACSSGKTLRRVAPSTSQTKPHWQLTVVLEPSSQQRIQGMPSMPSHARALVGKVNCTATAGMPQNSRWHLKPFLRVSGVRQTAQGHPRPACSLTGPWG